MTVSPSNIKESILIDDDYFKTLLADINHAQKSIDLEIYMFEADEVGKKVADALIEAANRGVNIRVLVDGVGTMSWDVLAKELAAAGIKTRVFNPLPWKISHWINHPIFKNNSLLTNIFSFLYKINMRNHRKICMIDNNIVLLGSANISKHLIDNEESSKWHEIGVKIEGVTVNEIQQAFNFAWNYHPLHNLFQYKRKQNGSAVFRLNYSWHLRRQLYKALINKITMSKKRIWVINAYFVPDEYLLKKLIKASKRNVDVRILLPHKSDIAMMPIASASFYSELLANGVSIYEYLPAILHAKVLIIDDWYSVGSTNLNYRSFKHDLEVDVIIQSEEAKKMIESQFLQDIKQSRQFQFSDLKKQSLLKKIVGQLILLIKYWI